MADRPDWFGPALTVLRRMYPHGLPEDRYQPLLAALSIDLSQRNIAELVSEFTERDYGAVLNDVGGAVGIGDRPPDDEVASERDRLLASGWIPEEEPPRYAMPGFAAQAAAVLKNSYPDGFPAADYLPLLAALDRDIDRNAVVRAVTEAFPGRGEADVWFDADEAASVPSPDVDRVWRHLLSHGWIPSDFQGGE